MPHSKQQEITEYREERVVEGAGYREERVMGRAGYREAGCQYYREDGTGRS